MNVTELYEAAGLRVGEFRCRPGDRRWDVENEIPDRFHVVLPWTPVGIARGAPLATVATPNHAVLYRPGQRYRRLRLSEHGDHCLFVAVPPEQLDRRLAGGPDPVLAPELWLGGRLLARYARMPDADPAVVESVAVGLLDEIARADEPERRVLPPQAQTVESTKAQMAAWCDAPLPLARLAGAAHYSRFHLPRIFRRSTGYSLHQYHVQLRLRLSVALLLDGRFTAGQAGDRLGFRGPSHFAARFRAAFGVTPSEVRSSSPERLAAILGALLDRARTR